MLYPDPCSCLSEVPYLHLKPTNRKGMKPLKRIPAWGNTLVIFDDEKLKHGIFFDKQKSLCRECQITRRFLRFRLYPPGDYYSDNER